MSRELTGEPTGPLTDGEDADFCDLDDRVRRGDWLSSEETDRRQGYLLRVCLPPPPEVPRERREKLRAQGIDLEAAHAAFKRGDHEAVDQFLVALAPPPSAEIAILERRVTMRSSSIQAPARLPLPNNPVHDRARSRRRVRRTVRLAAHGPPSDPVGIDPAT